MHQSVDGAALFFYHVVSFLRLLSPQSSKASLIASRMKCFSIKHIAHTIIKPIAIYITKGTIWSIVIYGSIP